MSEGFDCHTWRLGVCYQYRLVSNGQRLGILLNIPQCVGQNTQPASVVLRLKTLIYFYSTKVKMVSYRTFQIFFSFISLKHKMDNLCSSTSSLSISSLAFHVSMSLFLLSHCFSILLYVCTKLYLTNPQIMNIYIV